MKGRRIGLPANLRNLDDDSEQALAGAVEAFKKAGATIVDVTLPQSFFQASYDWVPLCAVEAAVAHAETYPKHAGDYGPVLAGLLDTGLKLSGLDLQRLLLRRATLKGELDKLLASVDLLLLPVMERAVWSLEALAAGGREVEAVAGRLRGRQLRRAVQQLRTSLAPALYGEGEQTLAAAAVQALEQHRKLLVCSDAAAGALLESRLENLPGAEKVFDFGAMSYANTALTARLSRKLRKAPQAEPARTLARVQVMQKLTGAALTVGCVELPQSRLLLVGGKKGCWLRCLASDENPGLWLLDMLRRAACGLPQAGGTNWQPYGRAVPDAALTPASLTAEQSASPRPKRRRLGKALVVLLLLALAALAAGWYYTGGDLAALPQKLQSLGAESLPHAGAKLV